MYSKRIIQKRLERLFRNFPIVLVTGARQVGKTTMLKEMIAKGQSLTFDPYQDIMNAREEPDLFLQNLRFPVFLDEVQFAPEVLSAVKRLVDEKGEKSLLYLSGSQNFSVLKNAAESMAGRVAIAELYPFSYREWSGYSGSSFLEYWLNDRLDEFYAESPAEYPAINRILWRGSMPATIDLDSEILAEYFASYIKTYIERDIRTVAEIQDLSRFTKFFRLLSALSAQEINANHLGRELGIDRTTALRWESLCESSYQWFKIPAFHRNSIKRISGKSKGYFADTGLLCFLQGIFSPEILASHPLYGHAFETFVVMEIKKTLSAWSARPELYHYRTYAGAEVDLILDYNGRLYPIEIKLSSNPGKNDARGIQSFREAFPNENIAEGIVVCSGQNIYKIKEGVWAVPWWML